MNLNSIGSLAEFMKLLENETANLVFFVHSNWATESSLGLSKVQATFKTINSTKSITIIDNSSASSFIYNWLQKQTNQKSSEMKISNKNEPWVHGKGELFGIINKELSFFEPSTVNINQKKLERILI